MPPVPPPPPRTPRKPPEELLPFKPWMLALAVFLGCALGVAIMEDLRSHREQWAQNAYGARR
jgi:uncharacterized protein involved in exopolysaccharide biosynthesis